LAFLTQNTAEFCKKVDYSNGFLRKNAIFSQKSGKNRDHNIDPWKERTFVQKQCKLHKYVCTYKVPTGIWNAHMYNQSV
jgi:hypothetical protein